jgi:DNA polymerase-3 subunit beta
MKIRCNREALADHLTLVARVASTRASLQIATHIRVQALDAEQPIELAATDLELSLRHPIDGVVDEPGAALLPAKLAPELIRALPGDEVVITADGNGPIEIAAGEASYTLYGLPVADFPQIPALDPERTFGTDAQVFADVVGRIQRAASRDESRPVLMGALVRFTSDKIVMAATDSYRLAVTEAPLDRSSPEEIEAIVPIKALQEAVRLVGGDESLQVQVGEGLIAFGIGSTWLTARLIEGQFPNFDALRPDTIDHSVVVAKDELLDVVRRVGIVIRHNTPIRMHLERGQLGFAARTADVAEGAEAIPVAFDAEADVEIGFNHEFLRDGVESTPGDEVRIGLISPLRPALIEDVAGTFWYVIMPIRI